MRMGHGVHGRTHWPVEFEVDRRMPTSGTAFVGEKGKLMWEAYSGSPRVILARRFPGRPLASNGVEITLTNLPGANEYVQPHYRSGWTL